MVLLHLGQFPAARTHLEQGIALKESRGWRLETSSSELRAVMSLSRLWQQQSKKEEARQMLAEVYGWFTEGFDTADLKEAKGLWETLSA